MMTREASTSTPQPTHSPALQHSDRQTILSLIAGTVIWFLHLNIVYPLTSVACKWEWFPFTDAGMTGLRTVQLVITFIAAVLIFVTIYLPWRSWRRFQTDAQHIMSQTEKDRRPLLAFITMALNMFLLAFVVTSMVPTLVLSPCS
jgi:hypothetical protein